MIPKRDEDSELRNPTAPYAPSVSLYRRIATLFLALTAGVVLLVAYVVFAHADVIILSKQNEVKADFLVDIARSPGEGEVKGDVLEVQDSLTQTFPSASSGGVDAQAEGQVKISSSLGRSQTLIATTRLLTSDQKLFRIKKTVVVPASGSIVVDAFADQPGTQGEITSANFSIPGLNSDLRKHFTAAVASPFTGGRKDGRIITQQDIDKAAEVVSTKLGEDLRGRLEQKAKDGGSSIDGEDIKFEMVSKTTDVTVGSSAEQFVLTVTVKATGVFYDKAAFNAIVRAKLVERMMENHELFSVDEGAVTREVDKRDLAAGRVNLQVSAKGTEMLSSKSASLDPQKLTGISVDAAQKYLQSLDGVASASVRARPFWIGRMPNVADHIHVEVR